LTDRWTVSQKNRPLPADQWTTTRPEGSIYSGSLSNDRWIRPFRSGPLSTVHEPPGPAPPIDGRVKATTRGVPGLLPALWAAGRRMTGCALAPCIGGERLRAAVFMHQHPPGL